MNNDFNMPDGCQVKDIPGQREPPMYLVSYAHKVTEKVSFMRVFDSFYDGPKKAWIDAMWRQDLDPDDYEVIEMEEK